MESNIEVQSQAIAQTIDEKDREVMPMGITATIGFVIPALQLLASCWSKNENPAPAQAIARLRHKHEQNPDRLRRAAARRIYWNADGQLSRAQAAVIADRTIEHALAAPEHVASACIAESVE